MNQAILSNSAESMQAGNSPAQNSLQNSRSSLLDPRPSLIPSRHDNPFATCWTRPGALPFRFTDGHSASELVATLAMQNWRGAIVGPHGSGKTTLLETLKPSLVAAGCQVQSIALRDGQRRLPRNFLHVCGTVADQAGNIMIAIDGYEQLGWLSRARIKLFCRRRGTGLLVTSHRRCHIRTLIQISPSRKLIGQLVDDLCCEVPTGVTTQALDASYACHGSNVREIFFDLYDRHERLRRTSGTVASTGGIDCHVAANISS